MVKCCIVGCTSGYKWIKAISRLDFKISKNTYVCEKHFNEHEIVRYWISGSVKVKTNKMENALEEILKVRVKKLDDMAVSGGCISGGSVYQSEDNKLFFVKKNSNYEADKMFNGELEGLKAIRSTKTVLAPKPIATGHYNSDGHFIVMEYLNITALGAKSGSELGSLLADMHMHNLQDKQQKITKFGFHVETCCGFVPQNNTWTDDWLTFFIENRLEYQMQLLHSNLKNTLYNKKMVADKWSRLKPIIPKFFEDIEVKPSLVHGDLWIGNSAQANLKPVIFDPAAFYGHHEYDIASTSLFGRYPRQFYDAYFEKIPKTKGFDNRITLYHLFHYLNHWNHFGGGYTLSTFNTFDKLLNVFK